MGQCAPSSPLNDSQNSIYDEEVSFVTIPTDAIGCNGGLPLQKASRENRNGNDTRNHVRNNVSHEKCGNESDDHHQSDFLQVHKLNIPQRCIVDQCEIKRAVWLQSDEILRRQGLLKMHGVSIDEIQVQDMSTFQDVDVNAIENNRDNDQKSMLSEPSTASAITSTSKTTIVATNTMKVSEIENSGRRPILSHSIQKNSKRYQCMSMLQLKMKAKVGWFYTQRYLTVFPSELKSMIGMDSRNDGGIPELTSESLDGSLSSSCSSDSDHANSTAFNPLPSTLVKCPVTNESLFDLAIIGCLGLVPREENHNPLRSSRRQLRHLHENSSEHCIVLMDKKSGSPLAVCAMKGTLGSNVVRIYYTRQIAFAQKPTTTTQQLGLDWADDLPLYAWAEVHAKGEFPEKMSFTVFIANRFDGSISSQPSYMAHLDGQVVNDNAGIRSPVMRMVGRTDSERKMSGCALIWIQSDEVVSSCPGNHSDLSFRINLARGIDPAFLICFTAIVDEFLEKSMRVRYKNKISGRKRKDSFSLTKNRLEARSQISIEKRESDINCKVDFCKYTNCNF